MDTLKIFRHKALSPTSQMKPPTSPSRFRAPVRHYHRHTPSQGASWDAWVGAEPKKKKSRFVIPIVSVVVLLLISALLVIGYAMI